MKTNMYADAITWNPFKGCLFDCVYCRPSFQRQAKRQKHNCRLCYEYKPHEHTERLPKIPNAEIVFVAGNGDISFARPEFVKKILTAIKNHNKKRPYKIYYLQSKNPQFFNQYLDDLPENVVLVTTLETNRDLGYRQVSKAPLPTQRFKAFRDLEWPRKVVTIEPIMDFDPEVFLEWMKQIDLEYIWLGYNSRPKQAKLPEPTLEKTKSFIKKLEGEGFVVKGKELRGLEV